MSANEELPRELAARWDWGQGAERRALARRKLLFFTEQHRSLVVQRIGALVNDDDARLQISAFASRTNNLVRSVVEAVAVGYSRGVRRELEKLGEGPAKAFADIVTESGIGELGWSINKLAWLCGPILVGPSLVDNELRLDVITPARNEVKRKSPNALSEALWRVGDEWLELDGEAWRYYKANGDKYHTEPHAAGRCPLAILRCDSYLGFDDCGAGGWWTPTEHAGLIDATLDLGYKHAFGLWTRHNGSNYLTVINAELKNVPAGQTIAHPVLPLHIEEPGGGNPVSVFDRSVNPDEYLREMAAIVQVAVSRYGIPPSEITFANDTSNWGVLSINVRSEKLGLLRDQQVPWLLRGERQLWGMVVDVLRASSHRHARALPPSDELRDALRISFPDLSAPDERKKQIEALQAGLGLGLSNATDLLMEQRPELTRAEAQRIRMDNINDYAKGIEDLASRNLAMDDAGRGVQSVAQIQGREGGRISGEVRRGEGDAAA